jgi:hypothetical protein
MHSLTSKDDESHKQQAHSDANSEGQVGTYRDALRFPTSHQNASHAARMGNIPSIPDFQMIIGRKESGLHTPNAFSEREIPSKTSTPNRI